MLGNARLADDICFVFVCISDRIFPQNKVNTLCSLLLPYLSLHFLLMLKASDEW
jgi:hypothetical protein